MSEPDPAASHRLGVATEPIDVVALLGCQELVEGLKARLPVWKYEVSDVGGAFVAGRADAGPTL